MTLDLDKRKREDLEERIGALAASYTPQWRYDRQRPDMGSVLAGLYAELMEEVIRQYNQMPERNQLEFFSSLGVDMLPARPAEGYLIFSLARADMPETVVPAGTGIAAERADGEEHRFETLEDVYVSAAKVELVRAPEENAWYLMFDRNPVGGVVSLLFSMEQRGGAAGAAQWEYEGDGGWKLLQAEDQTDGLAHTGIVRFFGGADWRPAREGYRMRIRRAAGAPMPGGETAVHCNAAPVRAAEPGVQGNLPAGVNCRLTRTVGYVSGVTNPDVLCGGSEQESRECAVARGSARIRHQFRAVTPGDFERLVYEICPDVRWVKCFAGYEETGARRAGAVTVVVLPEDYRSGRREFYRMRDRIMEYLSGRAETFLTWEDHLHVACPVPVRIHVDCEVCTGSYREVLRVQRDAGEALERFLDPIGGNHDGNGWDLGDVPEYGHIKACLTEVPGVVFIKNLRISYEISEADGYREILWERLADHPWILPEAGACRVVVTVGG